MFHDDQHGTAIIVAAGIYNGLRLVGKALEEVKLVTSGAGAAALACLNQLVSLGIKRENIWATDIAGVVYEGRQDEMDRWKAAYAQATEARSLAEVIGSFGGRSPASRNGCRATRTCSAAARCA